MARQRCTLPEYISASALYTDFDYYRRYYLCWYGQSEIVDVQPRVYVKGYASLYRITLADGQSTIVAYSARITILRRS